MKKVVKDKPKCYYMDCFKCGCQFSYELKDIQLNIKDDELEVKAYVSEKETIDGEAQPETKSVYTYLTAQQGANAIKSILEDVDVGDGVSSDLWRFHRDIARAIFLSSYW